MVEKVTPEKFSVHVNEEKEQPSREMKGKDKEVSKGTSKPITEKEAS